MSEDSESIGKGVSRPEDISRVQSVDDNDPTAEHASAIRDEFAKLVGQLLTKEWLEKRGCTGESAQK